MDKMKKPEKKYPAYDYKQNKLHIDEASGNGVYNQACTAWEKYHNALLKKIAHKLPKIEGYSPEATKLLKEYRERVVEVLREMLGENDT